ncbi:MAG: helix-turn-helix domain-containing protein [Eubacterium sp.]|nr:helix-turn-helix domain-containing protein [Eubacterium sp.]
MNFKNEEKNVELSNRWYSLKEICEYLGVSRDTVFKWIETKGMPAHKMGRQWKFKLDEVDEWVKAGNAAD